MSNHLTEQQIDRLFMEIHGEVPTNTVILPLTQSKSIALTFHADDYDPDNEVCLTSVENDIMRVKVINNEMERIRQGGVWFEDIQDKYSTVRVRLMFKDYIVNNYLKQKALQWYYARKHT